MRVAWCLLLVASGVSAQSAGPALLLWQKTATKAEVEADAARVHAAMDLDHDGYVTRAELLKAANARVGHAPAAGDPHQPVPALVMEMFDEGDTDHDGRISDAESRAGADAEFARDDIDHDGVVTPDERLRGAERFAAAHAALITGAPGSGVSPNAPAEVLDRLDTFRDGLATADRRRLDQALPRSAGGGVAQCDRGDRSRASCEVAAYMRALRSTGLMPRFLATIR